MGWRKPKRKEIKPAYNIREERTPKKKALPAHFT